MCKVLLVEDNRDNRDMYRGRETQLTRRSLVLRARSVEARACSNAALAHARLLREDSAALIQCAKDLCSRSKRLKDS